MTKKDYLEKLEELISSIDPQFVKSEIQYYSDYFESVGDEKKVIEELGSPEDVAKVVLRKYKPSKINQVEEGGSSSDSKNEGIYDEALYFAYDKKDVKNLRFNFAAANVVFISGDEYSVETRGVSSEEFRCRLDKSGTLEVSNTNRIPTFGFFKHDRKVRVVPRILVTVPKTASIYSLEMKIGAGAVKAKGLNLNYQTATIDVGAGALTMDTINGGKLNARCGMGALDIAGTVTGKINLDCGMGSVKIDVRGNIEDYSFDTKTGMGDVRINGEKKSVIGQNLSGTVKDNHFSVNCGMGSVVINIKNTN